MKHLAFWSRSGIDKLIICGLCALLVTSCKEELKIVSIEKTLIVKSKKHAEQLYFSGEIKPLREAAVSAPADSSVTKLMFNFGEMVKKDQPLIELDSPSQQKEYDDALTSYLKAKDELDVAIAKFAGTQSLWDSGLVSENSYKGDKSSLFTNKISFLQAKAKLIHLAAKLKDVSAEKMLKLSISDFEKVKKVLNKNKNKIILKAPHDGIALLAPKSDDKNILRVGSELKSAEVIALIGDVEGLAITIKVPEINIDKIDVGMKALVTGIAFPGVSLEAKVVSINAQANSSAGSSGGLPIFTARVVVAHLTEQQKKLIKIGMSTSVKVILEEKLLIMIPIKAVKQHNGKIWLLVKNQQGSSKEVEVKTGISTSSEVQIRSGLSEGDQIVWQEQ